VPAIRLSASWIVPLVEPPVAEGAVLIGDDGRILAIGPEADVPAPPGVPVERHPGGILLPGLVNAHTHLELTGLGGQAPEDDFPEWIRTIRRLKLQRTPEEFREAARTGIQLGWAGGVTTVADTGDSGAVVEALADMGGSGIVFHEVFGPHPDQLAESMAGLESRVADLSRLTGPRVRLGVSPHAPYSVSGPLYRAVARLAEQHELPMAVHLAESLAEQQLIESSTGPFAEAWRSRGIPLPDSLEQFEGPLPIRTPVRWLDAHGVLGPETLAIHVVRVDADDVNLLARGDVAIAHCPLSNARHGHGEAPLRTLLSAGLRIGVGTDSEASVGSLDLFAEAREARRIGRLSAGEAFSLITLDAALAVGMADVGGLSPGFWGDVCLVDVSAMALRRFTHDPIELAMAASPGDVAATWLAGREVWRRR
jgi:cytosine/adenosine deaminase-related metal-dependent hydrolase